MRTAAALVTCFSLLVVTQTTCSFAAGSSRSVHIRSLLDSSSGGDCSADGICVGGLSCVDVQDTSFGTQCTPVTDTTARCKCTAGPLPENSHCTFDASTQDTTSAPCDPKIPLQCNTGGAGGNGICLPANILTDNQDCSATGAACRRGTSCVALDDSAAGTTNYTSCVQASGATGVCQCKPGPVPDNGYCFIYGAACAEGSTCYTGRADATGGYCKSGSASTALDLAPGLAPAPSTEAPPTSQTCSPSGKACGNGQTCLDTGLNDGAVCAATTLSGCQCSSEGLPQGSTCDLYGAPCVDGATCVTPRADTTVGKCKSSSITDLLPSGSDCSATGTYCAPGSTCVKNSANGAFCPQTTSGSGACTCSSATVGIGTDCDPWGAPCYGTARCLAKGNGTAGYSCSSVFPTVVSTSSATATCSATANGPFCAAGQSCLTGSGSFCTFTSQGCTCSGSTVAANQACQLYGAPCADGTSCSPSRADSTAGFCLPYPLWGTAINKAGAGSSSGGVTGAWTGGVQGPNGANAAFGTTTYTSFPEPPPPPPPTPTATLRPVSKTATKVYAVKAKCTLTDVSFTDFQQPAYQKTFITTLTNNIEALTGSPVNVTIDSYADGSVTANITTEFLDNNQASAQTYSNVMKSGDPSKVFGTGYGSVSVDPNSVQTVQVSNPAHKAAAGASSKLSLAIVTVVSMVLASTLLW